MRFLFRLLLVLLVFHASTALIAEIAEYYPTDVGSIWVLENEDATEWITYTVEAAEERFNRQESALLKREQETLGTDNPTGEIFFVHFDEMGIKLHKIVAKFGGVFGEESTELSPPVLFFPTLR